LVQLRMDNTTVQHIYGVQPHHLMVCDAFDRHTPLNVRLEAQHGGVPSHWLSRSAQEDMCSCASLGQLRRVADVHHQIVAGLPLAEDGLGAVWVVRYLVVERVCR